VNAYDRRTRRRALDPFFSTKAGRPGLGLSVAYGIVRRHGGTLRLRSRPGEGTAVRVTLPAAAEPAVRPLPVETPPPGTRVLVVEDDRLSREALVALLERSGFRVAAAATGGEGVALLGGGDFDLVLTDLGLPDRSGWEVAAAARGRPQPVPVVLITGWGLSVAPEEGRRRGVASVLRKPVPPKRLLATVARSIRAA
jgi:CheY-like chemotaxis protein